MGTCAEAETCDFFNDKMADMPSTAALFKAHYCFGEYRSCARHMVREALGSANVPSDLFPDEVTRAKRNYGA